MEDEWEIYQIVRNYKGKGLQFEMCFNGADKDCVKYPTLAASNNNAKIEL